MADSMSSREDTGERNPFAPPPADAPDQPWQPRLPQHLPATGGADGDGSSGSSGSSGASGASGASDSSGSSGSAGEEDETPQVPSPHPWGPGYRGPWSAPQPPERPKFDPNDPVQRHSRYALTAGMAAMFCVVTSLGPVALLLGALAVYWAVSALRAGRRPKDAAPGHPTAPQTPAALGGLVIGTAAVLFVLAGFAVQLYYADYLSCVQDALTEEAARSCSNLAPDWLVTITNPDR
ncbi:hypothetical protein [Kitasatospora camelliae]|uniref:DUF4190 domain-containing protein n=1 Tax=Kitasatospora camelliae TaxID=3156397 RepID=A0AAU8JY18_9ACTN